MPYKQKAQKSEIKRNFLVNISVCVKTNLVTNKRNKF